MSFLGGGRTSGYLWSHIPLGGVEYLWSHVLSWGIYPTSSGYSTPSWIPYRQIPYPPSRYPNPTLDTLQFTIQPYFECEKRHVYIACFPHEICFLSIQVTQIVRFALQVISMSLRQT